MMLIYLLTSFGVSQNSQCPCGAAVSSSIRSLALEALYCFSQAVRYFKVAKPNWLSGLNESG